MKPKKKAREWWVLTRNGEAYSVSDSEKAAKSMCRQSEKLAPEYNWEIVEVREVKK